MKFNAVWKILSFALILGFVSCGDDDAENREQFLGTWNGTLSGCNIDIDFMGQQQTYNIPNLPMTMAFTAGTADNAVAITVASAFFADTNATGTVNDNVVTIDPFTVELNAGPNNTIAMTLSGPATLSGSSITMDAKVEALEGESQCSLELTK